MGLEFAYLKLRSWNRYMKLWGWNLSISSYGLEFEYLKLRGWRGSNSSYINDSYALGVSPLFGGLLVTPAVSCRGWWHHGDSQHWLLQKWSMESWRLDEQLHFSWGWAAHHVTRKEKSCSCYVAVAVVLFGHGNTWSCILLMSIWINIDINLINGWQTNTNRFFLLRLHSWTNTCQLRDVFGLQKMVDLGPVVVPSCCSQVTLHSKFPGPRPWEKKRVDVRSCHCCQKKNHCPKRNDNGSNFVKFRAIP